MKCVMLAAVLAALVIPVAAQEGEGTPLLRVYIDTPYFYDILVTRTDWSDPGSQQFDLVVEGKEVGASHFRYDCGSGAYSQEVITEWTGSASAFVRAALLAYDNLFCG